MLIVYKKGIIAVYGENPYFEVGKSLIPRKGNNSSSGGKKGDVV